MFSGRFGPSATLNALPLLCTLVAAASLYLIIIK